MKLGVKIIAAALGAIVLLAAGALLYRYFVADRIADRGGMENPDAAAEPTAEAAPEGAYKNQVTVSSVEELAGAIGNDTRVILRAGVYNFSKLDGAGLSKPCLQVSELGGEYGYTVTGVSNLAIEAEEGAEVSVVTENPGVPVLNFEYCSGIYLKGLTCGHEVEPGHCSGSVVSAFRTKDLTVEDCRLYGSGTYGLDIYECEDTAMKSTDIYQCTEGIVHLSDAWHTEISECRFYGNLGYAMFIFSASYDVLVEATEIYENQIVDSAYYPMAIECTDSEGIVFRSCAFRDNNPEPAPGELPDVTFENCVIPGVS